MKQTLDIVIKSFNMCKYASLTYGFSDYVEASLRNWLVYKLTS
jgi:hypothetical protein